MVRRIMVTGNGSNEVCDRLASERGRTGCDNLNDIARDRILAHLSLHCCGRKEEYHYQENCVSKVEEEMCREYGGDDKTDRWISHYVQSQFGSLSYDWYIYTEGNGSVSLTPDALPGRHKVYESHLPVDCEVSGKEVRRGKARAKKRLRELEEECEAITAKYELR